MKNLNKKDLINDWQVNLFALCVGLLVAFLLWGLAHISFIFLWLVITLISIPFWSQVAEKARKRFKWYGFIDAMLSYITLSPDAYDPDEDEDRNAPCLED